MTSPARTPAPTVAPILALPRTAAAQSALAHQVDAYCRTQGLPEIEAINLVAQELNARRGGGDIFWALAHVSAAHKNANALCAERQPGFADACEAQLSFGS